MERPHRTNAEFEWTNEFRAAFDLINRERRSAFITGQAGTGKSALIREFIKKNRGSIAVVAPTGLAALNLPEGETIHRFFGFKPGFVDSKKILLSRDPAKFRAIRTLVIDEVSMVRADLLDAIDACLRLNRDTDTAFGGMQVIFVGDCLQLAPIVSSTDEKEFFTRNYRSEFFFDAKVFGAWSCIGIELTRVFRQHETDFVKILSSLRDGRDMAVALQALNSRAVASSHAASNEEVTLTATNERAGQINNEHLQVLASPTREYHAEISGDWPEDARPSDEPLRLKVGAKVMLTRNDPDMRWVNGSIGWVERLEESRAMVRVQEKICVIEPVTWEQRRYIYDAEMNTVISERIATYRQLPLRLGYAMTIHKSQGQSFDQIYLDLGDGAFAAGQLYVAVSRCRSLNGLRLARPVGPADLLIDRRALDALTRFQQPIPCPAATSAVSRAGRSDRSPPELGTDARPIAETSLPNAGVGQGGQGMDQPMQAMTGPGTWRWLEFESKQAKKLMLSDRAAGLRRFDELLLLNRDDGMIFFMRGQAFEVIGDFLEAMQDYAKAASRFPWQDWQDRARNAAERLRREIKGGAEGTGLSG